MNKEEFAIAFSEKEQAEAIREVSLKIKSIFPKDISNILILFTPEYQPRTILKTITLTLNPKRILGLQAPSLIFEGRIVV